MPGVLATDISRSVEDGYQKIILIQQMDILYNQYIFRLFSHEISIKKETFQKNFS